MRRSCVNLRGRNGRHSTLERLIGLAVPVQSSLSAGFEQPTTESEAVTAGAIGEETVMADATEAIRQSVQQKAADELVGIECHDFGLAVRSVVFPGKADLPRRARAAGCWRWRRDGCSGRDRPALDPGLRTVAWRRPPSRGAGVRAGDARKPAVRLDWRDW